jgi:phosphonate degradation associated HDIG domain protein
VDDGDRFVTEVLALLADRGRGRYDERVTQIEHAVQCALLASADGASDTLLTAALLHDVGHLLHIEDDGQRRAIDLRHEAAGAAFLRDAFPSEVVVPIALHVAAKRYLVSVDREYAARLTPASQRSFELQGGPMRPAERAAFEARPFADAAVKLRRWDDAAKCEDVVLPDLDAFAPVLVRARGKSLSSTDTSSGQTG